MKMKTMRLLWLVGVGLLVGGCPSTGVGDPCVPESVPTNGFQPGEAYLETSSVQCRTRVCMVYQFGASVALDPRESQEECLASGRSPAECAGLQPEEKIDERVYCTCRCSSQGDSNTPTCSCPSGFTCQDDLLTLGGDGIRGGYCVRNETLPSES